jgi:hypothetical protein
MMQQIAEVAPEARERMKDPNPRPPTLEALGVPAQLADILLQTIHESPAARGQLLPPMPESLELSNSSAAVTTVATDMSPADKIKQALNGSSPGQQIEIAMRIDVIPLSDTRDLIFRPDESAVTLNQPSVTRKGGYPVKISSIPLGAAITIEDDPEQRCDTPCVINLRPGRRVLSLSKRGYDDQPYIVEAKPNLQDVTIKLGLRAGTLSLAGAPEGTPVVIAEHLTSYRAPTSFSLPEGRYEIRLVEQQAARKVVEVDVRSGSIVRAQLN